MKLFLASSLDKTLPLLLRRVEKPPRELRVIFIANASDPIQGETWWVGGDRKAFQEAGCNLVELDLRNTSAEELAQHIEESDILHVCGGSVLYILALIRKRGMFNVILEAVKQEKILYTGTSAGSIIAAPSVQLYSYDPEEREASDDLKEGLEDLSGFAFVNFLVKPHMNNPEHLENAKKLLPHFPEVPLPTIMLHDSQAVWVENGKFEIISVES